MRATHGAASGRQKAAVSWSIRPRTNWICCSGLWARSSSSSASGQISIIPISKWRIRHWRLFASRAARLGNIVVSNSQKPGIYGKVHVHGQNGASVGVQTDGGAMFIAGRSSILEPPVNDIWTVAGEENMLDQWKTEDSELFCGLPNAMDHTFICKFVTFCGPLLMIVRRLLPEKTAEKRWKFLRRSTVHRKQIPRLNSRLSRRQPISTTAPMHRYRFK